MNWNKDEQIVEIYNETLKTNNIDITKINEELLNNILDSSYNPVFIGTTWKLYKYLQEESKYKNKLFWIASGNTVGFFKYHGHIPWDDDIDIGFEIHNHGEYIDFLIECINKGFVVNLHLRRENNDKLNWYENDNIVNLILNNTENPSWPHIKENEFRQLIREDPTKLYFGSITILEYQWKKIAERLKFDNIYSWNKISITTPWVDVVPYLIKNNKYIPMTNDNQKIISDLSTTVEYHDFLSISGKFPVNLLDGILHQYNEDRSFNNFIHWDAVYSHIKKNKIIIEYDKEKELHKFIRAFIIKYNDKLLDYMKKIKYDELVML